MGLSSDTKLLDEWPGKVLCCHRKYKKKLFLEIPFCLCVWQRGGEQR